MSLINEALKRTRDASFQSGMAQPMSVDQYRIANHPKRVSVGAGVGIALTGAAAVLVIACAIVWFVGRPITSALRASSPQGTTVPQAAVLTKVAPSVLTPAAAAPTPPTKDSSQSVQVDPGTPAEPKPDQQSAEEALIAKLMEKMKAEQAAAVKPVSPPKLVLQGITGQRNLREAMINNVNVREGEDVEGARVVSIDARSVKLRFGDQDLILRLP